MSKNTSDLSRFYDESTLSGQLGKRQVEHANKVTVARNELSRSESLILQAVESSDVDAVAELLPRRDALKLILERMLLMTEELKAEEVGLFVQQQMAAADASQRERHAIATRKMALTEARDLRHKLNFAPAGDNLSEFGRELKARKDALSAKFDELVRANGLQDWELNAQ